MTALMTAHPLTKSEFLDWRDCAKSAWLARHRPETVDASPPSAFDRMLMADGYAVEHEFRALVRGWPDAAECEFQVTFEGDGCLARADLVRRRSDRGVDLYEVKSSTSVKSGTTDHLVDLAFQCEVARRSGVEVLNAYLVHVDGAYVRNGELVPEDLFVIVDASASVREVRADIASEIDEALRYLALDGIDETSCECRYHGSIARRCAAFAHLNPDIPELSAHLLPRISRSRLEKLDGRGDFSIEAMSEEDVTATQLPVLRSFRTGAPVIDESGLDRFLGGVTFPIVAYDYESFSSAVPIADGLSPHSQIPVQFSMDVLDRDGSISHHEHICDAAGAHGDLVDALANAMPTTGSILVWNESYEKGCNRRLARLLPHRQDFLAQVDERTIDLMAPFRSAYVDSRFMGSTSIKKVLPVLCPHLRYDEAQVHDGAGAMEAWYEMVSTSDAQRRRELRRQLLEYCRLDSLAMIEIWRALTRLRGRSA